MSRKIYREVFPKRHTFLPVVHVLTSEQVYQNTRIALDNGADGVFLINHDVSVQVLLSCYLDIREWVPSAWIGLNLLGLDETSALRLLDPTVSGWQTDDAGMDETLTEPEHHVRDFYRNELAPCDNFNGLYFGGVDFKGNSPMVEPARMARLAAPYMDVVTTSGLATGHPPPIEKIRAIRSGLHGRVLAVASGMTPDNVDVYLPYVDCFLVATGIGKSFYELDSAKVSAFAKKMEF